MIILSILLGISLLVNVVLVSLLVSKCREHKNDKWQLNWYNRLSR